MSGSLSWVWLVCVDDSSRGKPVYYSCFKCYTLPHQQPRKLFSPTSSADCIYDATFRPLRLPLGCRPVAMLPRKDDRWPSAEKNNKG